MRSPNEVLRDLLARALPYIPTPIMVDAVSSFLVTGSWVRPFEHGRYWLDPINRRIDTTMTRYCIYRAHATKSSVKTQIHALDSLNRSIAELEVLLSSEPT
jgi:hypothetical protein